MKRSFVLSVFGLAVVVGAARAADEGIGKVAEVNGETAVVTPNAKAGSVRAGDQLEFFTVLPDLNSEAVVTTGRVVKVADGAWQVKLDKSEGKVRVGHRARLVAGATVKDPSKPTDPPAGPAVTYDDLERLLKDRTSEDEIVKRLGQSPTHFKLDQSQVDELKKLGASDRLLAALQKPPPAALGDVTDVALILDCSGSMADKTPEGPTKMEAAKKEVTDFVQKLSNGRRLTFLVYGHDVAQKCEDVQVVRPLSALDDEGKAELTRFIAGLEPKGYTPIAKALGAAGAELAKAQGVCALVLVTDGMETCNGNPAAEAARLAKQLKLPYGVIVIGFDVKEDERKAVINIVDEGKGEYLPAKSATDLAARLSKVHEIIEAEPSGAPAGIHVSKNLRAAGWTTYRFLTHFQATDDMGLWNARLSGDGSHVLFSCTKGTFVMAADANPENKPVKVGKAFNAPDTLAISGDGKTVAWSDPDGLFVAASDGTGKKKLPGGFTVDALRLDEAGERLIVVSQSGGAVYLLSTDGETVKRLTTAADVNKLAGTPGDSFRAGQNIVGVSDDGKRVVFRFGFLYANAFTINGDGTGLRQLTHYGEDNKGFVANVAVSGDGATLAYHVASGKDDDTTHVLNWEGKEQAVYSKTGELGQLSRSGKDANIGIGYPYGFHLCSTDGGGRREPLEMGTVVKWMHALSGAGQPTLSADFRRACIFDPGRGGSGALNLVLVDFNPRTLEGMPVLKDLTVSPRFLLTDGSTNAELEATLQAPDLRVAGITVLRDGMRSQAYSAGDLFLTAKGEGEAPAGDRVYATDDLRLMKDVAPGPVTVRLFAINKNGDTLTVDVERVEARAP